MTGKPGILLLGDSIRASYEPHVAKLLDGKAVVTGPSDNCQYSSFTLESIDKWINELGKPDIVHWNNGLHDCGHNPDRNPIQIPIEEYKANLEAILVLLRKLTPTVIWATTTPTHPSRKFLETEWSWRNEEITNYNQVARDLMQKHNVPINDLHDLISADPDNYLCEDLLHLSPAGQKVCAQEVAIHISRFLP